MELSQLYSVFTLNEYVQAVTVFIIFFIVAKIIAFVSQNYLLKITEKTETKIDDLIISKINRPLSVILVLIGARIAITPLSITQDYSILIGRVLFTLVIIVAMKIVIEVFDILIDNWGRSLAVKTKSKVDDQLMSLLHRISKIIIAVLGLIFILDTWGVNVGPLLASLGIAGIAVAFAMQSTLGNIFGGISMIIDKAIKVGDVVKLDADTIGTVYDVGLRSTKIRTFDNEIIIVPNGKLADAKIMNFVQPDHSARLVVPFSVGYGSNIEKVKKVVLSEIKKHKEVLKDPAPFIRFTEMAESSLNFKAYMWLDNYSKRFVVKDEINTAIYNTLNKNKIPIPFPQLDVHLKK